MPDRLLSTGATSATAIALDGGTTNTRARLVRDGSIIAVARRSVGARDTVLEQPKAPADPSPPIIPVSGKQRLADAIHQVIAEVLRPEAQLVLDADTSPPHRPSLIVATGMLSSDVGLVNVPHVTAPAGLHELALAVKTIDLPTIADLPIHFVPGVRTPVSPCADGWFDADVMRGEECETIGAWLSLRQAGQLDPHQSQAFLWPGSHTKLVEVDRVGRITRSHTTLAGEWLQAVSRHTILVASLPESFPDELNREAAEAGSRAVNQHGLGRAAFLVRIAALTGSLDPTERASFWIGAVVADDVAHLAPHPILAPGRTLWVGGKQPLRSLYADWLSTRHPGQVVALTDSLADSASALGSLAIAFKSLELLTNC
jgi:2-dehydro-3-deoxygalactonokinase